MDEDGESNGDDPVDPEPVGDDGVGVGGLEVEEGGAEEGL